MQGVGVHAIPAYRLSLLYLISCPWPLAVLWPTWGSWKALPLLGWELGEAQAEQEMDPHGVLGWSGLCAPLASLLLEELERLPALPGTMDHCMSLNTRICCRSLEVFQLEAAARRGAGLQHRAQCCIALIASCRKGLVQGSPGLPVCALGHGCLTVPSRVISKKKQVQAGPHPQAGVRGTGAEALKTPL